jgi:hypothetical protein
MAEITGYAAARYVERIAPGLTPVQAVHEMMMHAPAIDRAAAFGCRAVRLCGGVRLRLEGDRVVTVERHGNAGQRPSRTMMKRWKKGRN